MKRKATLEVLLTDELIHSNNFMPLWNGIQSRSRPFVCWFAPLLSSGKESSFLVESNQVDTVYSLFSQNQLHHIYYFFFFCFIFSKIHLEWVLKTPKNEKKKIFTSEYLMLLQELFISALHICVWKIHQPVLWFKCPNACMLTKNNGFLQGACRSRPQTAMNSVAPLSSCRWA